MVELKPINQFPGCKIEPLTEDASRLLMTLLVVPTEKILESSPDVMESFPIQVAKKRLEVANVDVDEKVLILLADWSTTVGDVVMFCHAVSHKFAACKTRITLSEFVDIFPMGTPSKETRERFWDYQKGRTHAVDVDNILDQMIPSVWPSVAGTH